ncbi:MAG: hypothetical protein KatS3mg111_2019 [Pirellulaceae bacterium]|nr:MAG: hypothetical protein KatS3mg111_2019 [Pirellulaceae bacterium]
MLAPGRDSLTDDIPSPGRWRDAVQFIREQDGVVFVQKIADALGIHQALASRLLAQAVLSGKVKKLGHQRGWTAAGETLSAWFAFFSPLGFPSTRVPWRKRATMGAVEHA